MEKGRNDFKLVLMQEDVVFCEKLFNADNYSPYTRYSVDIRRILPKIINDLQYTLSNKDVETSFDVGNNVKYNLYDYFKRLRSYEPYMPETKTKIIQLDGKDKVIRGVEFKIGLYINENPIVERIFFVDGFNPMSRYSIDIYHLIEHIAEIIMGVLRENDIMNIQSGNKLISNFK